MSITGLTSLAPSLTAPSVLASSGVATSPLSSGLCTHFARYTGFLALVVGLQGCGAGQATKEEVQSPSTELLDPPLPPEEEVAEQVVEPAAPVPPEEGEYAPQVGIVIAIAVDAHSREPVPDVSVRIIDVLNRSLTLTTDPWGQIRFENIPKGRVRLEVEAPGYLRTVRHIKLQANEELKEGIILNGRPKVPNVVVTTSALKLKRPIRFQPRSTKPPTDLRALIELAALFEEIADVLRTRPDITLVEIQGHTDDIPNSKRLSKRRAMEVMDVLLRLGVEESRLEARGYGKEKPLVPNTSDANRAKNNRIEFVIKK